MSTFRRRQVGSPGRTGCRLRLSLLLLPFIPVAIDKVHLRAVEYFSLQTLMFL